MSDSVRIITNNVPRALLDACELTEAERAKFDYLDWSKLESGEDSRSFFRYRGEVYDFSDFGEGAFPPDRRWVYQSDSFFSGVLVRYAPAENPRFPDDVDTEYVIVGRY